MRRLMIVAIGAAVALAARAEVTMDVKPYGGWDNCVHLSNGQIELVATTDVGPRIIRLGFVGEQNVLKEYDEQMGQSGGDSWRIYGGHRLWHAPEVRPRTYNPDNEPVQHEWDGTSLVLTQPVEETTGISKQMVIRMDSESNHVVVTHRLRNENPWDVELSPWALTVMAQGGTAIVPQEEFRPHPEYLLPARSLTLWHYTDMSDPRWTWGDKYIQLRQDPNATTKQKFGCLNKQGWMAYALKGDLFIKRYPYEPGEEYPDYGVNTETYTDADMLEMETLGPLDLIEADGDWVEHEEHWFLMKAEIDGSEESIDANVLPLVEQTRRHLGLPAGRAE